MKLYLLFFIFYEKKVFAIPFSFTQDKQEEIYVIIIDKESSKEEGHSYPAEDIL